MMKELHLERLLGCPVLDGAGRRVGRIEEVVAEWKGDRCYVREYHLGPDALLERLSASAILAPLLRLFGRTSEPRRVPWDALDLSDPEAPRLR
jgi:hypothetical protein